MNKYHNKKITLDGIVFDSRKEAKRYRELLLMQKAMLISNLQRQVEYELIPNQYKLVPKYSERTGRRLKDEKKLVERKVCYAADFVYTKDGEVIVEDIKSPVTRTKDYIIKRKLMLYIHGIKIKEI